MLSLNQFLNRFQVVSVFPGDQLDEASAIVDGYNSYFSFSKVRSGYSGNYIFFCYINTLIFTYIRAKWTESVSPLKVVSL